MNNFKLDITLIHTNTEQSTVKKEYIDVLCRMEIVCVHSVGDFVVVRKNHINTLALAETFGSAL